MRINKFLAQKNCGSRREIDQIIESGLVHINGIKAYLGQKLEINDLVQFKDIELKFSPEELKIEPKLIIALNKPIGIVCTCDHQEPANIIDYLKEHTQYSLSQGLVEKIHQIKIYPIGRLDKNSRGLILLTNDGALTHTLTHPKFQNEKEYLVTCKNPIDQIFLDKFTSGVKISKEDINDKQKVITAPCKAEIISKNQFTATLHQGYKRQIRKMTEALGNEVIDLFRIRISNLAVPDYTKIHKTYKENIRILDKLNEAYFLEIEYSWCHLTGNLP